MFGLEMSTLVYIYDCNFQVGEPKNPILELKGHTSEGYGLAFHRAESVLASCSEDGILKIWDLENGKDVFEYKHTQGLNCLDYSRSDPNLLMIAAEDYQVLLLDVRTNEIVSRGIGNQIQNAIATCSVNFTLFASGTTNGDINLWDVRNLTEPVHNIAAHMAAISRLHFCNDTSLLASSSQDGVASVFDFDAPGRESSSESEPEPQGQEFDPDEPAEPGELTNTKRKHNGQDRPPEDEDDDDDDCPPELIFTHSGHRQPIYDLAWSRNPETSTLIASVAQDFSLHLWQMTSSVLPDDYDQTP
ncbi:bifunctional WD40 repeat/WD40-repeat-containing domain superfamily/WD40 repeat [Babesia duncani]|uniref:Bifunctional WD40 repeat/WD40-repeat-containing domain superfamily/WD40 repeat n=1 Tax=Babesia duncani TaxID=323732 RepID=A0AAD9UPJ0_9APIC|nr:bifunctional WD40 repeat/WD40-repeat-containing domain superfamily/WD40 repeat [Babesia duncani]